MNWSQHRNCKRTNQHPNKPRHPVQRITRRAWARIKLRGASKWSNGPKIKQLIVEAARRTVVAEGVATVGLLGPLLALLVVLLALLHPCLARPPGLALLDPPTAGQLRKVEAGGCAL